MSSDDWTALWSRLVAFDVRGIDRLCQDVLADLEDDVRQGHVTECKLTLSRFTGLLDARAAQDAKAARASPSDSAPSMSPEAKGDLVTRIHASFDTEADAGKGPNQKVISLRHIIEDFLTDAELAHLGAKNTKQIRKNNKYSLPNCETAFIENVELCFHEAFPQCELKQNDTGREMTFCSTNGAYKERLKGYYFTNLRHKKAAGAGS